MFSTATPESNTMRPITYIMLGNTALLGIAGSAAILGWFTEQQSYFRIGKIALVLAIFNSCLPLVALGSFQFFAMIKRRLFHGDGRTN